MTGNGEVFIDLDLTVPGEFGIEGAGKRSRFDTGGPDDDVRFQDFAVG